MYRATVEDPAVSDGKSSDALDALFEGRPDMLSVREVAELFHMSEKNVYVWLNRGTIPGYKIGATWHVLRDELKTTMLANRNLGGGKE